MNRYEGSMLNLVVFDSAWDLYTVSRHVSQEQTRWDSARPYEEATVISESGEEES